MLSVVLLATTGCQLLEATGLVNRAEPETVYIPGTKKLVPVKSGDMVPGDGFFVPPALMSEIGPCLADALKRDSDIKEEWRSTGDSETVIRN